MRDIEKIRSDYKSAFDKYGREDYRSLFSESSGESAKKRYMRMSCFYPFEEKNILEIGCGWGSFFRLGFDCKNYYGVDLIDEFINDAKRIESDSIKFRVDDINKIVNSGDVIGSFDVMIMSSVMGERTNFIVSPDGVRKLFLFALKNANVALINFPSIYKNFDRRDCTVEYFDPSFILGIAMSVTKNVIIENVIDEDFLVVLRRSDE